MRFALFKERFARLDYIIAYRIHEVGERYAAGISVSTSGCVTRIECRLQLTLILIFLLIQDNEKKNIYLIVILDIIKKERQE